MSRRPGGEGEHGFASIDALVAMTILAITLSLAFGVGQIALRASDRAHEINQADVYLRLLMERPELNAKGAVREFNWTVETRPAPLPGSNGVERVCGRAVTVQSRTSFRSYQLASIVQCPN